MNDFERVKSDSYITIANTFLKDKNLSNKAKGVLAMILALPDNWDFCIKGMVSITKDGEASLRSAINEMKENGYCAMKPVRINNKIARWKYLFSGEKLTEELLCDFLHVENLNEGNQAQYNNLINEEKVKNKKSLSNDIPKKRFKKPTIEEIQAYIKEKKRHFDAERFFDYYESKGWLVGKSPMKDWKAACRTWEHSRQGEEKKEEDTDEMPAGMTREKWMKIQEWMQERLPRIWKYIDVDAFLSMEGKSGGDRYLQRDIMLAIDRSTYEGDMVEEFERLRWTEEFKNRLPSLQ